MIVGQHPDQPWVAFARALPALTGPRVGLFTTYKLATGGMFAQMRRHLADRTSAPRMELKSRNGRALGGEPARARGVHRRRVIEPARTRSRAAGQARGMPAA